MPKYMIQSDHGKQAVIEAVRYFVTAINTSKAKLGKDVAEVSANFDVEGVRYSLVFTKVGPTPENTDVVIQEQASGGVQSGGS